MSKHHLTVSNNLLTTQLCQFFHNYPMTTYRSFYVHLENEFDISRGKELKLRVQAIAKSLQRRGIMSSTKEHDSSGFFVHRKMFDTKILKDTYNIDIALGATQIDGE